MLNIKESKLALGDGNVSRRAQVKSGFEFITWDGDGATIGIDSHVSGLAIAVADASPLVKEHAHWTTNAAGGRGAAREVCELIMQAQGTLEKQIQRYLRD